MSLYPVQNDAFTVHEGRGQVSPQLENLQSQAITALQRTIGVPPTGMANLTAWMNVEHNAAGSLGGGKKRPVVPGPATTGALRGFPTQYAMTAQVIRRRTDTNDPGEYQGTIPDTDYGDQAHQVEPMIWAQTSVKSAEVLPTTSPTPAASCAGAAANRDNGTRDFAYHVNGKLTNGALYDFLYLAISAE